MINLTLILNLKYPGINFIENVQLGDTGDGPHIVYWNFGDTPEPTQGDLDAWAIEYYLQLRQSQAVSQRIYPPLTNQLDMMYHDHINSTTVWVDTIEAIKVAHPKPTV